MINNKEGDDCGDIESNKYGIAKSTRRINREK